MVDSSVPAWSMRSSQHLTRAADGVGIREGLHIPLAARVPFLDGAGLLRGQVVNAAGKLFDEVVHESGGGHDAAGASLIVEHREAAIPADAV